MRALTSLTFLVSLTVLSSCSSKPDKSQVVPQPSASASAAAQPSVSAAPSAATSTAPTASLGAVAPRKIAAGPAPNGTWTAEFGLERVPGDENLDWSEAVAHCQSKGKELCLETQWQRACELDPEIGKLESWTLTADYPGAAVRGGAEGCKSRVFKKVADKSPTRVALCCDRAVALTSDDKSEDFRAKATARILEAEALLQGLVPEKTRALFANRVALDGTEFDRDAALAKLAEERKGDASRLAFFDHCNIKMSEDVPPLLLADCGVVQRAQGRTRGFAQRLAFAGMTGPIAYLGDPKAMKPKEQKEQKERVKAFLPSE